MDRFRSTGYSSWHQLWAPWVDENKKSSPLKRSARFLFHLPTLKSEKKGSNCRFFLEMSCFCLYFFYLDCYFVFLFVSLLCLFLLPFRFFVCPMGFSPCSNPTRVENPTVGGEELLTALDFGLRKSLQRWEVHWMVVESLLMATRNPVNWVFPKIMVPPNHPFL